MTKKRVRVHAHGSGHCGWCGGCRGRHGWIVSIEGAGSCCSCCRRAGGLLYLGQRRSQKRLSIRVEKSPKTVLSLKKFYWWQMADKFPLWFLTAWSHHGDTKTNSCVCAIYAVKQLFVIVFPLKLQNVDKTQC